MHDAQHPDPTARDQKADRPALLIIDMINRSALDFRFFGKPVPSMIQAVIGPR